MAITGAREIAISSNRKRVKVRAYLQKGILTATALTEAEAITAFMVKFNTRALA